MPGAVVWCRGAAPPGTRGRVLPDGCMDLLLWDGELVVAGPDTHAFESVERLGEPVTGLRLPPGAGPRVFGVRAHELRDQRVPLAAVWSGREVRELSARVAGAADPATALEAVARRRLRAYERAAPDPREAALTDAVVAALRHGMSVAQVAARVGLSERQLHRRCLDAFGYGAKTLARILRLRTALRLATAGTPLATTALRAGYADQAHFAREVKSLAGVPVTELTRPPAPRPER
ncbi:helix-turn-helix transcriptional regulator [Streptomyces axinellae]|uniref:Helix-turn-helix transcriptional regulator n=1 Tax=Streptomyces axinellae TaxID=552788 RepID=A0ABN3PPG1_9ACTN